MTRRVAATLDEHPYLPAPLEAFHPSIKYWIDNPMPATHKLLEQFREFDWGKPNPKEWAGLNLHDWGRMQSCGRLVWQEAVTLGKADLKEILKETWNPLPPSFGAEPETKFKQLCDQVESLAEDIELLSGFMDRRIWGFTADNGHKYQGWHDRYLPLRLVAPRYTFRMPIDKIKILHDLTVCILVHNRYLEMVENTLRHRGPVDRINAARSEIDRQLEGMLDVCNNYIGSPIDQPTGPAAAAIAALSDRSRSPVTYRRTTTLERADWISISSSNTSAQSSRPSTSSEGEPGPSAREKGKTKKEASSAEASAPPSRPGTASGEEPDPSAKGKGRAKEPVKPSQSVKEKAKAKEPAKPSQSVKEKAKAKEPAKPSQSVKEKEKAKEPASSAAASGSTSNDKNKAEQPSSSGARSSTRGRPTLARRQKP